MLTQERLKELLHYDPETGVWTWRVKDSGAAGYINRGPRAGYRRIKIDSKQYNSSRLAHLYMTGEWPIALMDHISGVRDDDRWRNLRNATQAENMRNKRTVNQTGVKGVWKVGNKYKVEFWVNRKSQYFGTYATIEEATAVATVAGSILHGEYAISSREAA